MEQYLWLNQRQSHYCCLVLRHVELLLTDCITLILSILSFLPWWRSAETLLAAVERGANVFHFHRLKGWIWSLHLRVHILNIMNHFVGQGHHEHSPGRVRGSPAGLWLHTVPYRLWPINNVHEWLSYTRKNSKIRPIFVLWMVQCNFLVI